MNQKLAKALRKFAKNLAIQVAETPDKDGKTSPVPDRSLLEMTSRRRTVTVGEGDDAREITLSTGTLINDKRSLRGIYRTLKRGIKTGELSKNQL